MSEKLRSKQRYYLPRFSLETEHNLFTLRKKGYGLTKNWLFRLIKLAKYYKSTMRNCKRTNIYRFSLDSRYHNFKMDKSTQLLHFLQTQKNLRKLLLSFETNHMDRDSIDDHGLIAISHSLPKLKKLASCMADFKRCPNISNLGLCKFFRNISFCNKLENLDLNIAGNVLITQPGLKIISKSISKLKNLKSIVLNFSWTGLKNQSLQEIIKDSSLSEGLIAFEIHIESCHDLESQGFARIFHPLKSLSKFQHFKLNMKSCYNIDENEIFLLFGIVSAIDQLRSLSINMTWCNLRKLQFPGIMTNPKGFMNLRQLELNFRGCSKIEKNEVATLDAEARLLPRIKTLSIFSY